MTRRTETLLYIDEAPKARDVLDRLIEETLLLPARVHSEGTQRNIPHSGPLVLGFLPHSGWLEPFVIDHYVRKVRGPAVWMTKRENQDDVPTFLLGHRRFLFVDRDHPELRTYEAAMQILASENGILASAFEGTRYGNPLDPDDVLTLGEMKPGLMRLALQAGAPLMGVVVLGADQVLPSPEKIKASQGMAALLKQLAASALQRNARIELRFLPPYTDHLTEIWPTLRGEAKRSFAKLHTEHVVNDLIAELLRLRPGYPLGRWVR